MQTLKELIKEYDSINTNESLSAYIGDKVSGDRVFLVTTKIEDDLQVILENFSDEQIRDLSDWDNILDEYFSYYCDATCDLKIDNCEIVYD